MLITLVARHKSQPLPYFPNFSSLVFSSLFRNLLTLFTYTFSFSLFKMGWAKKGRSPICNLFTFFLFYSFSLVMAACFGPEPGYSYASVNVNIYRTQHKALQEFNISIIYTYIKVFATVITIFMICKQFTGDQFLCWLI